MSKPSQEPGRSILPLSSSGGNKHTVKTTIVGGQPPGNQRPLPPIPQGIEHLLSMAAVNPRFGQALLLQREEAINASGVRLSTTEHGILGAVDPDALQQMIRSVHQGIPEQDRRSFLNRSAAALVALVGGGLAVGGASGCPGAVKGSRPDRPEKPDSTPPAPDPAPPAGIRPDRPGTKAGPSSGGLPPLEKDWGEEEDDEARPNSPKTGSRPDRPGPTKGIRPDRPGRTRGIRPDRPRTKGIRPDRPRPKKPKKKEKKPSPPGNPGLSRGHRADRPKPRSGEDF